MTEVEELSIHFVALFSQKEDAIPVILLHGWPGSFLEFLPLLQIFREEYIPSTLPYHFIVPSMPGYAFSSGPPLDRNFTVFDVARIFNKLMNDLGFGSGYVAQGGDIGSSVGRVLAVEYASCKGKPAFALSLSLSFFVSNGRRWLSLFLQLFIVSICCLPFNLAWF